MRKTQYIMVTLERLQHAVALANTLSFVQAAAGMGLSQSAFSRSIQALENELGVELFARNNRRVSITDAGLSLLEDARQLIAQAERFAQAAARLSSAMPGAVRMATNPYVGYVLAARAIESVRSAHPGLQVHCDQFDADQLAPALRRAEYEFCICETSPHRGQEGLHVEPFASVPIGFVVRAGHPLLSRPALRPADLLAYGLAANELPPGYRAALSDWFDLKPDQALSLAVCGNNAFAHWQLVHRTDLVGLAALPAYGQALRVGRLVQLSLKLPTSLQSDVGLVRLAEQRLSRPAEALVAAFRQHAMTTVSIPLKKATR
jgi:DNA-binding transcriptional LysR family regulator